ncbi:uncharacterized protein LOC129000392 [Macrosteles quadrilineatus]|uniref:uncharacterized protein LOC129000392 n=1 Tax=Macrosteles quadrilineatus TaxID=74068 RepID=UPI0023E1A82C|nr:uncharacterized protein LOC129000392 [Macrosteles quadrilineatus]
MLHLGSQTLNGTSTMELLTCKECVRKKRVSCGPRTEGCAPLVLRRCTRPCCNHRPRLLLDDQLVSLCSVLEISTMPRLPKQPEVKPSPRHRSSVCACKSTNDQAQKQEKKVSPSILCIPQ